MRLVSYNQLFDMLGSDFGFEKATRKFYNRERKSGNRFPVRMDMVKEKDAFKILVELPGMEKDKIKIMAEGGLLTISGDRARETDKKNESLHSERFHGSFSRSFKLPETVKISGISADYKNGLLEVTLPLKEEKKPKQIEVQVN
jgi:HSP20 family protein